MDSIYLNLLRYISEYLTFQWQTFGRHFCGQEEANGVTNKPFVQFPHGLTKQKPKLLSEI